MPENRNSGVTPNRHTELNAVVSRWVDMNAATGPANARAVRTATGIASTIPAAAAAPNSTMTRAKIVDTIVARVATQPSWPKAIANGRQRRGVHRVVALDPVEAADHRERRLEHRALHDGRDHQRRREPLEVGHAAERAGAGLVDEPAQADAHRQQEQGRLDEVAEGRPAPGPPVEQPHVLVGRASPRAPSASGGPRSSASRGRVRDGHQSTSVRPVRLRNTSSSELRRTSTVSGTSPRWWAAAAAASPSSE